LVEIQRLAGLCKKENAAESSQHDDIPFEQRDAIQPKPQNGVVSLKPLGKPSTATSRLLFSMATSLGLSTHQNIISIIKLLLLYLDRTDPMYVKSLKDKPEYAVFKMSLKHLYSIVKPETRKLDHGERSANQNLQESLRVLVLISTLRTMMVVLTRREL
jgi:hypothetical protein